jgi:hypothetical protein
VSASKAIREQVKACQWFHAEDVIRWALGAYYRAAASIEPPQGEPWECAGVAWSSPGNFAEAFHAELTERINREAEKARILPCDGSGGALGWGHFAAVQDHKMPPCSDDAP